MRVRTRLFIGAAIAAASTPCAAQTKNQSAPPVATGTATADPVPQPDAGQESGDIVVTAQRRSENLQRVPIAVSAFNEGTLDAKRIDSGPQLVLAVPNVTFAKSYFGGFNFQIRGVGTQLGTASADSGVGIHLNNMPLTSSRFFEAELYDVRQVEVLRGPQGTLYGRNATGGVVNVMTAQPEDRLGGLLTLEAGTYNTFKAKGALNLPISDTLAVRLAGSYLRRSGFGENTYTGKSVNGRDLYSTRLSIRFKPSDTFTANFMWQHFNESDDRLRSGGVLCTKDSGPSSVGGAAVTNPIARGLLSQGCANASIYANAAHSTPNSLGTLFGILPQLFGVANGDYNAGGKVSTNLNDTQSYFSPTYRARNDLFQLAMDLKVADGLTLSSLTGYTSDRVENTSDFFGFLPTTAFSATALTPNGRFADPQIGTFDRSAGLTFFSQPSKQFTQELRLQSSFAGKFNFALGANYLRYTTTSRNAIYANVLTLAATALNGGAPCALGNPACIYIDPNPGFGTIGHNYFNNITPYKLTSTAIFGELYYQITDDLKFTAGGRYTEDRKRQDNIPVPLLQPGSGLAAGNPAILTANFKEPTGRIGLDLTLHPGFADRSLLYAFYSRGYKAGGSNAPAAVGQGSVRANYRPEFVNSFEVGLKNSFMNGRLTANLTAFYYGYKDYQIAEIVAQTQVVQNVNAKVFGLEFETAWRPDNRFQLDATAGYLYSRINNSSAIDPLNITNGNTALTLVKASNGSNCAVSTSALANLIATANTTPTALLGVCSGAFAAQGIVPSPGEATQLDGNRLPNAPRMTASIGAQYGVDFAGGWRGTLRGDFYVQSRSYARIYNAAIDRLRGWNNVNMTLTIKAPDGWQGQFFVRNLLNKQPVVGTFLYDPSVGLYAQGFTNDPRVFGVNLTKTF